MVSVQAVPNVLRLLPWGQGAHASASVCFDFNSSMGTPGLLQRMALGLQVQLCQHNKQRSRSPWECVSSWCSL